MLILHGDNMVASRKVLNQNIKQAKTKGNETLRFNGKKLTLNELQQALESKSLFGTERLIIVENLLSSSPSKTRTDLFNYLKKNFFVNLILWEGKEIKRLAEFKKAKIQLFKLPPTIFQFLDSLTPGEGKTSLSFLHLCLKQGSAEMVFYMLARQLRLLIMAADLGKKGLTSLHPFQQEKIARQAKKFTLSQLLSLHQQLLKIDWQQKTGQAPMPLSSQLDLLIASL